MKVGHKIVRSTWIVLLISMENDSCIILRKKSIVFVQIIELKKFK